MFNNKMSIDGLKKYTPDTPKEFSFIGSSIARLGSAMSGVLLFSTNKWWVLATLIITWLGHELAQYFKLDDPSIKDAEK